MQLTAGAHPRQPRITGQPSALHASRPKDGRISVFLDLASFAIPFASITSVKMIGVLPGGELLTLALVVPCIVWGWERIWRGLNKPLLILMGLWLLSQIVTDFYRQAPFGNMAKGEALIAFFGIDLIVLSAVIDKRERRIVYFTIGAILSNFISISFLGEGIPGDWKFGSSTFVIPSVVLVSCYFYSRQKYFLAELSIFGIAAYNLAENYRSELLILAIVGIVVFPKFSTNISSAHGGSLRHPNRAFAPSVKTDNLRTVFLFAMIAAVGFTVSQVYARMASSGALGDKAQEKYEMQSQGKFGILAGGRPEVLVSWIAVLDSPILGHGSWAEDPKYSEMLTDLKRETGYTEQEDDPSNERGESYLIPAHSHLMSAWVFSGILGAVFWVYVLYLTVLTVIRIANVRPPLAPLYAFRAITALWSIPFSPFGQDVRMEKAFLLVIVCTILEGKAESVKSNLSTLSIRTRAIPNRGRMQP